MAATMAMTAAATRAEVMMVAVVMAMATPTVAVAVMATPTVAVVAMATATALSVAEMTIDLAVAKAATMAAGEGTKTTPATALVGDTDNNH